MDKTKIKKIIERVDFLDGSAKKAWIKLIDQMNKKQLEETYAFFNEEIKRQSDYFLKLLVKNNLQQEYEKSVKEISKKAINSAKIKSKK